MRAVIELIWNSIDAEASDVVVRFERDQALEGITAVVVEDDGHGISVDEVPGSFGYIGDSWKSRTERTKNDKRRLHGSRGEGRLRAFALGGHVEWRSVSRDTAGLLHDLTIVGRRSNRSVFSWEAVPVDEAPTGTKFTAHNQEQRSLGPLIGEAALPTLRSQFAPTLLHERDLRVTVDGVSLDPRPEIVDDITVTVPVVGDEAELRIIEWRQGKHRRIYYGIDTEHFSYEEDGADLESQFTFSAYVCWKGLEGRIENLQLGSSAPEELGELWSSVHDSIREHFKARRRERRRDQVQKWKDTGIYPYSGEPSSEREIAERTVFDVVSGTLSPQIAQTRDRAKLTLTLLREAIRHDPEKLTTILHEVANLNPEDRDTLTDLLAETTLPAIIRSANTIASRNKFLLALEQLLYGPEESPKIGERDHLHKILENELWIFGEGYHLMNSEKGLTTLLRTHLQMSGFPERDTEPVKRWDGRSGRADLHIAAKAQEHDRIRHLVIELKAPDITIHRKELEQVEDYGNAILSSPPFRNGKAQWDLILVGTKLHEVTKRRIVPEHAELGQFWGPEPEQGEPRVRCFVRSWREIIDENRQRLDFMTSIMDHDPSLAEGLSYVRDRYGDLLPKSLTNTRPPVTDVTDSL